MSKEVKLKQIHSKEFDITLSVPLRGTDKFWKEWGFFIGDIIRTPVGNAIVTGRIMSCNKVGIIAKLKDKTTSTKYTIVKDRFIILKHKELLKWKNHLSKQGESIFIGTVKSVNLISINPIGGISKSYVRR